MKLEVKNKEILTGHRGSIYSLCAGKKASILYSTDGNGWVVQWDLTDTTQAKVIAQVPSNVFALCLLPQRNYLALGSMQGILYFIDLKNHQVVAPTLQLGKAIYALKVVGNQLWIGDGTGTLSMLDIKTMQLSKSESISDKNIRAIDFNAKTNQLAIGTSDSQTYLLDKDNWKVEQQLAFHKNSVFSATFVKNGEWLVTGARDAHLAIWHQEQQPIVGVEAVQNKPTFVLHHTIPAHLFTINHIVESPNKRLWATASRDKSIKIWDAQTFVLLKVIDPLKADLQAHSHSVNRLLWLEEPNRLLSASDDRTIRMWTIQEISS
ncbi:MAG: WD40 repeat domain-containing protein [Chitinophagales bacterium]